MAHVTVKELMEKLAKCINTLEEKYHTDAYSEREKKFIDEKLKNINRIMDQFIEQGKEIAKELQEIKKSREKNTIYMTASNDEPPYIKDNIGITPSSHTYPNEKLHIGNTRNESK